MKYSPNKRSRKHKKLVETSSESSCVVKLDVSSSFAEETLVEWQEGTDKSTGGINVSENVSKTFDTLTEKDIIKEFIGGDTAGVHDVTRPRRGRDDTADIQDVAVHEAVHDVTVK